MSLFAGIYQHYKGHPYLLLGQAHDHDNPGRIVVVYVGLSLDGAKDGFRMKVQGADIFTGYVNPETGEPIETWDGTQPEPVRRFTYLGPYMDLEAT